MSKKADPNSSVEYTSMSSSIQFTEFTPSAPSERVVRNNNKNSGVREIELGAVCRNCHDIEPTADLIAPCSCTGSIKWVHRTCLDEWRSVSPNPRSFASCDICQTDYQLIYERESESCCAGWRFGFYLSRDFLILFTLINIITTILSVIIWGIDRNHVRNDFTNYIRWHNPPQLLVDWAYGWVGLFFLLGIFGIVYSIAWFCGMVCKSPTPTYNTYSYNSWGFYYCFFAGYGDPTCCDCHGCCTGGGSGMDCVGSSCSEGGRGSYGSDAWVLLVIVVVVIVIIGLIVAVVLLVIFGMTVVTRHVHYLKQRDRAGRYVVADLSAGGGEEV